MIKLSSAEIWSVLRSITPEILSPWYQDGPDWIRDQFSDREVHGHIQLQFRNNEYYIFIGYADSASFFFNASSIDEAKSIADDYLRSQKYIID